MATINQDKIFIGTIDKENIYLTKHKWDCGWYWGFGYVGNKNHHFHIDSLICERDYNGKYPDTDINKVFDSTVFTQTQWWAIRDLFIQAYSLKKSAEVFKLGGHQTTIPGITDIIKNQELADVLNKNLEKVLDTVWEFMVKSIELNSNK